ATTPVVFVIGSDPVRVGLVASINRPGGNITGVVFYTPLVAKLLGMLNELVPKASIIAVLRDPNGPDFESHSRDLEDAARAIGRQILMVNAANEREFHALTPASPRAAVKRAWRLTMSAHSCRSRWVTISMR